MAHRIKTKTIGTILLAVLILTACGQKRALYLPGEPVPNNTASDSEAITESAEKGKD